MMDADQELMEETIRLQGDIDDTNADLADEVARGEVRDEDLNDHNVRLTVLRSDVDTNTDALVSVNDDLDDKFKKLNDDLRNSTNMLNDKLYETDRTGYILTTWWIARSLNSI